MGRSHVSRLEGSISIFSFQSVEELLSDHICARAALVKLSPISMRRIYAFSGSSFISLGSLDSVDIAEAIAISSFSKGAYFSTR